MKKGQISTKLKRTKHLPSELSRFIIYAFMFLYLLLQETSVGRFRLST